MSDHLDRPAMAYRVAPLFCRPWTLNGISPRLIESHYENNYGGALARLNAIAAEVDGPGGETLSAEAIHRLKRDEATALNSVLLHEIYFASLGGDGRSVPETMAAALARDFGSVERWRREFVRLASALAGGSGWVLLSHLPRTGRLINQTGASHDQNLAGAIPILAIDMYEHAYHLDFGANAAAYIAAFMRNIDWQAAEARYQDAVGVPAPRPLVQKEFGELPAVTVEEVREMLESGTPVQILDVRPRHYTARATDIMDGATWRDPERVDEWIGELEKDVPVVTFCVYGFHIGCQTALRLGAAGFDVRYMAGGHAAWKAIRGKVQLFR